MLAQRFDFETANVSAVDSDFARRKIVEARQQAHDCRLARSRWANQSRQLSGLDFEAEVAEHGLASIIRKVDPIEFDLAFEARRALSAGQVARL